MWPHVAVSDSKSESVDEIQGEPCSLGSRSRKETKALDARPKDVNPMESYQDLTHEGNGFNPGISGWNRKISPPLAISLAFSYTGEKSVAVAHYAVRRLGEARLLSLLTGLETGLLEESGISCVGVKSEDLRRKAKSEGNSLDPYRRWGGLGVQLTRETLRLGSTVARLKLKGIDGGLHKRWSIWFNSIQCAKPYQPLTYEQENLSLMGWIKSLQPKFVEEPSEVPTRLIECQHVAVLSTSHPVVRYEVGLVRPAKMGPQYSERCVLHSRGTASEILEEGGDDVKSAWPLWAGPHTCYNGNDNGKQGCKAKRILIFHALINEL
ncbi:hypothetical protein E6C27_scaffold128G001970 [Cucumis melo var. makuwa]|uniref:Uncharacterized protein n=1 Tax=Cucumis melo var. makuwa TaxID=1194695 RepID=A0A5A7TD62_CUCMM|nr:hypothetical protein E6C27_scaffold128G001970 [Cucumis melo var. makuwa]